MKKVILIGLAIVILGGLYAVATYKYIEHRSNAPQTVSLNRYNLALDTIKLHDGVAAQNATAAQTQITNITNQKTQACAVLVAHKLISPACQ